MKKLPIVKDIGYSKSEGFDSYYGMNVSPSIYDEPLDQIDGFFVAKYIQNQTDSKFYPYIAGVYEALNAKSPKEALVLAKNRADADNVKRKLLENIRKNMNLKGNVYVTYDLWNDGDYWDIFNGIFSCIDKEEIEKKTPKTKKRMRMKDFPKEILGEMENVIPKKADDWYSASMYIPAEIAEAVWFREKLNVSYKIGPMESESIYDDIISSYGIGIIGLTQPEYTSKAKLVDENLVCSRNVKTVPYIGKKYQNRITFSDNIADIGIIRMPEYNPSFKRALLLAEFYEDLTGKRNGFSDARRIYEVIRLGDKA